MIRITDEKIFTMTEARYQELWKEYVALDGVQADSPFEDWLYKVKRLPYTTYQQENP